MMQGTVDGRWTAQSACAGGRRHPRVDRRALNVAERAAAPAPAHDPERPRPSTDDEAPRPARAPSLSTT